MIIFRVKTEDDRIYSHIVELVSKMDGIVGVFHTQGTTLLRLRLTGINLNLIKKSKKYKKFLM
jgi:hypothetical protein